MPLPDIQLDDRTFEQLATELRRRIPAYTPEWTDHNESDPGITLIQLFSWLSEMIIWRLNQVPQKNYHAFLQLVGIDLKQPAPAVAELTFKLSSKDLGVAVPIPAGTQAQLDGGAGGPVVFETDETILAVGGELAQVQVYDGSRYQVVTEDHRAPGQSFAALSNQPQPGAALFLGFDRAFPPGRHRLTIHAAAPGNAPIAQVGADLTGSALPPVVGSWEYWTGPTSRFQPLAVASDTTNGLTRSGIVQFDAPAPNLHVSDRLGALQRPTDPSLFWIRFRIVQILGPGYESQPMLEDILLNTATATNAVTETDELLGASDGLPNQTFTLSNVPILPKDPAVSGIIEVDEGHGYATWSEVPDFAKSGPADTHYTINLSTGVVTFGDGINGKIPAFLSGDGSNQIASDVPNIKATSYRWGGGSNGNAGSNTITTLNTVIPYVDSVTNLRPAAGGQDEESVAAAGDRAPAVLRTQYRAVTADDFAQIALQTPGAQIVRAYALPLHHPTLSVTRAPGTPGSPTAGPTDVAFPGVVTVLVIPYSTDAMPVPSAATLQIVAAWLDSHRLVTTEVYVKGPDYRKVEVEVGVIADPRSPIAVVTRALNDRLLAYFNPITGGSEGTGWAFGQPIYSSETFRQILITAGVVRIVSGTLKTYVDDVLQEGDVALGPSEVVYSLKHTVLVTYS
jgi:predicted phage baseplate assembly protein